MGGPGSGRRPDPLKKFIPERTDIANTGEHLELPNYSGVKEEALRTSSLDITNATHWQLSGANDIYFTSGSVGIGTTRRDARLQIVTEATTDVGLMIGDPNDTATYSKGIAIQAPHDGSRAFVVYPRKEANSGDPSDPGQGIAVKYEGNDRVAYFVSSDNIAWAVGQGATLNTDPSGKSSMYLTSGGSLGIGTSSPGQVLEVSGSADITSDLYLSTNNKTLYGKNTVGTSVPMLIFDSNNDVILSSAQTANVVDTIIRGAQSTQFQQGNSNTEIMRINTTGVGIGKTPTTAFEVKYTGIDAEAIAFDTSSSSLDTAPAMRIKVPSTGGGKAFQCVNGNDTYAWCSFDFTAGGAAKPGIGLGPGGATARDCLLYRNQASVLRTDATFVSDKNLVSLATTGNNYVMNNLGVGINVPTQLLHVSGGNVLLGNGDLTFAVSGSGLLFGSCYGNETTWTQASAAQNVWYNISGAEIYSDQLNGMTHLSGTFTIATAGMYKVDYGISIQSSAANKEIKTGISVNEVVISGGIVHSEAVSANKSLTMASTAIVPLSVNDTLQLAVQTTDVGTPNISLDHYGVTLTKIGGIG